MTTSTLKRTQRAARAKSSVVGIYVRISKDRNDGKGAGLGVARQQEDAIAYADRNGLGTSFEVYDDNDRSGWDPSIERPGFSRMLADIRAGKLVAVVAWHSDRYTRQPLQLELLWSATKDSGTQLHTVLGGHVTSALSLRIQGAVSAEESDVKSARISRKHEELAMGGKFHGGRRRFGYSPGMDSIVEEEAWYVRQVAERILAGESLSSLARWLREEGVQTPAGGTWSGPNLGTMMKRPHLAGIRVHHGTQREATWTPILDRATYELVLHVLSDPARRTSPSNARVYLLAGLATCATCGAHLRGRPLTGKPGRAYACATGRHCHRPVEIVDQVVEDRVVAKLIDLEENGTVVADDQSASAVAILEVQLEQLGARLKSVTRMFALGQIDEETFAETTPEIQSERERLQLELDTARSAWVRPNETLKGMTGPGAPAAWEAASLSRKRAILELLFTIELHGAATRRAPFRVEDVEISPKD